MAEREGGGEAERLHEREMEKWTIKAGGDGVVERSRG